MESIENIPDFNVVHHSYLMSNRICNCIPKNIRYECGCILYIYNTQIIQNKLVKRCYEHINQIYNMYDTKFKIPFTQLIIDINNLSLKDINPNENSINNIKYKNLNLKRKCDCDHHNENITNNLKRIKINK